MCFSAGASFVTSGILSGVSVATWWKRIPKAHRLFATTPILFAIMQLIEGTQWLVEKPGIASTALGYAFLFFAFLVWLTFFPLCALEMETHAARRHVLRFFLWMGAVGTGYLLGFMITEPFSVTTVANSIRYSIEVPFDELGRYIYGIIVCVPLMLSSYFWVRLYGALLALSFFVAVFAYEITFHSVWCFFAAALSILVYFHVRSLHAHAKR